MCVCVCGGGGGGGGARARVCAWVRARARVCEINTHCLQFDLFICSCICWRQKVNWRVSSRIWRELWHQYTHGNRKEIYLLPFCRRKSEMVFPLKNCSTREDVYSFSLPPSRHTLVSSTDLLCSFCPIVSRVRCSVWEQFEDHMLGESRQSVYIAAGEDSGQSTTYLYALTVRVLQ